MADVQGSFTGTGVSETFAISAVGQQRYDNQFAVYLKPASFVGAVVLERFQPVLNDWFPINAAGTQLYAWTFTAQTPNISETGAAVEGREVYRLRCTAFTSGSLAYVLSSAE